MRSKLPRTTLATEPTEETADEWLANLRPNGSPQMLEALYYSSEDDLMLIMRLVAALDPPFRASVLDYAMALHNHQKGSEPS